MMGTNYPENLLPPDEGTHLFAAIRPSLSDADIVFGNLEGPLCQNKKTEKCNTDSNCYVFRTPPKLACRLKEAGFNVLSLANNHANDFGDDGRIETMQILDSLCIQHSGAINDIAFFQLDSTSIALIAFCWSSHSFNYLDSISAVEHIQQLKKNNDLVFVSIHGGCEGKTALHTKNEIEKCYGENRGNIVEFAHLAVDVGADLILGHGPHVPRAMEIYNNKLIAYSLGNFCTYKRFKVTPPNGLSLILRVDVSIQTGDFVSGKIIPIRLDGYGIPFLDPSNASIHLIQELTHSDFPNNSIRISLSGEIGRK